MSSNKNHSMAPLVSQDDELIIKKSSNYRVNDIVVFLKRDNLIAHRVIYISTRHGYLVTKGDNNLASDGKIRPSKILGKVETVKRRGQTIRLSHIYLSQSSAYLKQLKLLNNAFLRKRIPYIILKGLPLHLHFAKTPPKRLYLDTDILIKAHDLTKAREILLKLGFRELEPILFDKKVKNSAQIPFVKNTKPFPVVIDLHLEPAIGFTKIKNLNSLLPPIKPFTDYLFKNVTLIKINSASFPILGPETLVVYLLLHLYHHNFQGAHRMDFIDSLIRSERINWNKVASIIQKFNFKNLIFPNILMLKRYYQTPKFKSLEKSIEPSIWQRLVASAVFKLLPPFSAGNRVQEGVKRFILLMLLSRATISKKIEALLKKDTRTYLLFTIKSFFLSRPVKSSKSRFASFSETL